MNKREMLWALFVFLLLFSAAIFHPMTRPIVWFILPLGLRPDDLFVFGIFAVLAALFTFGKLRFTK